MHVPNFNSESESSSHLGLGLTPYGVSDRTSSSLTVTSLRERNRRLLLLRICGDSTGSKSMAIACEMFRDNGVEGSKDWVISEQAPHIDARSHVLKGLHRFFNREIINLKETAATAISLVGGYEKQSTLPDLGAGESRQDTCENDKQLQKQAALCNYHDGLFG
ncbi:B-block binding subunit of TFIIIC [Striga asiatica]|uniref:B-block binding subunit of TFIIIC n=1 Tax=Striga asiatica TaxID=4170 RepID=A0A5A7R1Z8_STRAF|nr:B-block binding subunit of TFIIIC [Striga asiatica]